MRSREVVVEAEDLHLIIESFVSPCVTCGAPRQVCSALAYRQVQSLDERCVERRGVLGVRQRLLESPVGTNDAATFHANHSIVPSCLQDLRVDAADAKEPSNDLLVVFESIGHDEGKADLPHPLHGVFEESARVSIATPTNDSRRPKSRGDVEGCEDPRDVGLPAGKRSNLVGLELCDVELFDVRVVENAAIGRGSLEPAVHGVPAESLGPRDGRLADALDAERGDLIESAPAVLKTVVRGVHRRAERFPAFRATVTASLPRLGPVEAVTNDVDAGRAVGAAGSLHFRNRRGRAVGQRIGRRFYSRNGLRSSRQQSMAEAPLSRARGDWGIANDPLLVHRPRSLERLEVSEPSDRVDSRGRDDSGTSWRGSVPFPGSCG